MSESNTKKTPQRTEEVHDIIDRMPHRTGKIVTFGVAFFAGLLILFGFIIKYPESVTGVATLSAQQAPVRLTSPANGRLHILAGHSANIKGGEIIAYIESGAEINDFQFLDSVMKLNPEELTVSFLSKTDHLALGELTIYFLKLLNSIESVNLYKTDNPFVPQLERLHLQKAGNLKLQSYIQQQLAFQSESHKIHKQNLLKDSIQFFQLQSVNEEVFLQSKTTLLNSLQNMNQLQKEQEQSIQFASELEAQKAQLLVEQKEKEQTLTINLYAAIHELKNQISLWKQKYTIIAPAAGRVEMLGFRKENDFVQAREEIFAILPAINPVSAQVLIPSSGAGKVVPGQEVIIKLDDFPYLEFGTINGRVQSISMLNNPTQELSAQQKINTYQVVVELPEQLKTNYGTSLSFKHDIKGMAQILVKKRKLIERLFDNLKYLVRE